MRISVIGKQFPDSLAHNLAWTLRHMGFGVQEVDEDALLGRARLRQRFHKLFALLELHPGAQEKRGRLIVQALERFRPDFVLNTYTDWHPRYVAATRKRLKKVKIAFLYPDATANLGREYPLAGDYDALFFKDPYSIELFRSRLGINARYLPEACNPHWHRTVELSADDVARYGCDVTTAGNMYYYRALLLEPFTTMPIEMKIWGGQFAKWLDSPLRAHYPGVYVTGEEKAKAFRAAKIVINTLSHKETFGTNVRTFEIAGCGGFQLADHRPVMEELFRPDEEIVLFRSGEELRDKVEFYLKRPDARRRIADAGQKRAHAEHTYQKRLEEVFRVLGL